MDRFKSKPCILFRSIHKNQNMNIKYTCIPFEETLDGLASFPIVFQNSLNLVSSVQSVSSVQTTQNISSNYMPDILSLLQSSQKTKGTIKKLVFLDFNSKDSNLKPGHVIYLMDESLGIHFYVVRLDDCFYCAIMGLSKSELHPTCQLLTKMIKLWNFIKD